MIFGVLGMQQLIFAAFYILTSMLGIVQHNPLMFYMSQYNSNEKTEWVCLKDKVKISLGASYGRHWSIMLYRKILTWVAYINHAPEIVVFPNRAVPDCALLC